MRISTIPLMMLTMTDMFPATFSTPKLVSSWEPQYRATLGHLDDDALNHAWHACLDGWTKKAAPSPADFLRAYQSRPGHAASNSNGKIVSLAERLKKRDADRTEDRRTLIDSYERDHAPGYAMARSEGWIGYLDEQVKRSANLIAQRNEQRRADMKVPDWKPEFCEPGERSESFVPWVSIVTHEGADLIEIEQGTLKVWRAQALIPGPAVKPIKQTALQNIGYQSVETSSAA